ncbi:unnamed protein product [Camellia sinensis]
MFGLEGDCITEDLNLLDTSAILHMEPKIMGRVKEKEGNIQLTNGLRPFNDYILELLHVTDATIEEGESLRNGLELVRSVSDKHFDLLRPSARYNSLFKGQATDMGDPKGKYTLIRDADDFQLGTFDKPLPCFGCGIGWLSFLLGFVFPLMWYYAAILYFGNYYRKDPRERAGLAASAICNGMFSCIVDHSNCLPILAGLSNLVSSLYTLTTIIQRQVEFGNRAERVFLFFQICKLTVVGLKFDVYKSEVKISQMFQQ